MKTTSKILAIAAACALPIVGHADIQHICTSMTLQELNQLLEDLHTESLETLEPLLPKIAKTRRIFQAKTYETFEDFSDEWYKDKPDDTESIKKWKKKLKEIFLKEHKPILGESNRFQGFFSDKDGKAKRKVAKAFRRIDRRRKLTITEVRYNENNEPISVEALHGFFFFCIERPLLERSEPFHSYIVEKLNPKETAERLNAFSREISASELKKRGIDIERLKELGIASVREMTFASILESKFFTDEQRKKAKALFDSKDKLEKAIETYAEAYPYVQKTVEVTFKRRCIAEEKKCNWDNKTFTWIDVIDEEPFKLSYLAHKPKDTVSEDQKEIAKYLKNLLPYKNGKEKVILLLLLDEITPPEYRLKWLCDSKCNYDMRGNTFRVDNAWCLSHEIGHYLQTHLGLYQTFRDYQIPFAKQLLQLENNQKEYRMITVPQDIAEDIAFCNAPDFWGLEDLCFQGPKKLSAKKFFECFQLMDRWHSLAEVSNILGVYLKGNTLYLNALSDIRELKRIRYTHHYRKSEKSIENTKSSFKEEADKALLGKIVEEAYRYPVPTKMLGLLCRLHQRKNPDEDAQNVVCDFDLADGKEKWNEKVRPLISDFIEAE